MNNNKKITQNNQKIEAIWEKLYLLKRLGQENSPEYIKLEEEQKNLYKQNAMLESGIFK